jgi:hypothetical protein
MNPSTKASGDSKSSGANVHLVGSMRAPSSSFIIAARLLLLFGAALALVSAIALAQAHDRGERIAQRSSERYVCPMHPEVVSRTAGECPICRMVLERVAGAEKGPLAAATDAKLFSVVKRSVVTQLVRAPAWLGPGGVVTAVLHKDDLVGLAPGTPALFFGTSTSRAGIEVRLSPETPAPWDASTSQVHFRAERGPGARKASPNAASAAAPGAALDSGWLDIAPRPRDLLVVPSNAVLYTAEGPYVVAVSPDGKALTKRPVEIGRILDSGYVAEQSSDRFGAIVVLAGLHESEKIAVEDTFFLDAERRLQEGRTMGPEAMP